jgi:hypothetical protein
MSGLSCHQVRPLFDAYLNGELSTELATELAAHRLKCAGCRHELALLELAGSVIRCDLEDPTPPADFTERLMACIHEPVSVPFYRRRRVVAIAGSALAAAACALIAVTWWPQSQKAVVAGARASSEIVDDDSAESGTRSLNAARLGDATASFQERFRQKAVGTRHAMSSLEEAGKRTILEIVNAIQVDRRSADDAGRLQQPLEELLESADEVAAGAEEEIEDL